MKLAILLLAAVLCGCASAPAPQAAACFHRSEAIEKDIGFCQTLRVGRTLYVSGVAGTGEMDAAVRSVYSRIGEILKARGLTFANVVKENVYTTDLDAFIRNKETRKTFYAGALPAATWVQVQRLYVPAFVLEVEVTAEDPR